MDKQYIYEICVAGNLPDRWSDWFSGLAIHNLCDGETKLCGPLTDQAELLGVLNKIHALNLPLVSVIRLES